MSRQQRRRLSLEYLEDRLVLSTITVAPVTVDDSAASSAAIFTARLAEASSVPITLSYATSNGSARAGTDYLASRSTVTIPAGQTSATFSVGIKPTVVAGKANEVFYVNLKVSPGNSVTQSKVAATIVDDLPKPTVTISDVLVNEVPGTGTTHGSVTVKLSAPSARNTVVSYQTIDQTATSLGSSRDYQAAKGSVTIKAGATSATIPLTIYDRATTDKTFEVKLTGAAGGLLETVPVGATFSRVVIHDSKSKTTEPALSVSSPTVLAGGIAVFNVSLSSASTLPVSVRYFSVAGAATALDDSAVNGILTIPAGQTTGVIVVPTATATAAVQQFQLVLASPANATIAAPATLGTIVGTSAEPSISVTAPAPVASPMPGVTTTDQFVVTLSTPFLFPVTVDYSTIDGTATAGTNYTAVSGTLTFAPGVTSMTVPVTLLAPPGGPPSADSTFGLVIDNPTDATIATGGAVATITASTGGGGGMMTGTTAGLTVGGGTVVVSTTGSTTLTFTVTLANASTSAVTVAYATADGTAVAGTDYTATSGTLTFAPGVLTQTVSVTVFGETTTSTDKTLTLNLSNPTNAQVTSSMATGDILYATGTPSVSVAPASANLGTSGTATLRFTVSLSGVSGSTVTVDYATADGTAVAGTDYTATSGTLTFAPGTTSETVAVKATGESSTVTTKTLTLTLSNASNTSNTTGSGVGTLNYIVLGSQNDISDNLANTSGGVETATGLTNIAASLTTGTSSFSLKSVTLLLDQATAGTATVAIDSDAGLQPGGLVGTLTSPTTYSATPTNATFTSTAGIALAANTTYWVVLSAPSGSYDWSWSSEETGTGIGFTDTWAETTDGGTTWFAYNSSPTQMKVIATATS